jgi:hypothetical protein
MKIFCDKWGWNTQLIRKAAFIKRRYDVRIGDCSENNEAVLLDKKFVTTSTMKLSLSADL